MSSSGLPTRDGDDCGGSWAGATGTTERRPLRRPGLRWARNTHGSASKQ